MADERDRGLHRHGAPDLSQWDEQPTYADREQKVPAGNTTFADRKAQRSSGKAVQSAENKAVRSEDSRTKAELVEEARAKGVEGYSTMNKAELAAALKGE